MKRLLIAVAFLLAGAVPALAANCSPYPYTLTNGQTADANQVMANFNAVLGCGNSSLLGKNNNLSDVASPATSRQNLGLGTSSVENLTNTSAGAVTDDGAGSLAAHVLTAHAQVFTGNGSFTFPALTATTTVFKFTVIGGGSGGAGAVGGTTIGSAGSSGGAGVAYLSGFTAGTSATITVGSGGAVGAPVQHGSAGNPSIVAYAAVNVVTSGGASAAPDVYSPSAVGAFSVAVGGSGLTAVASYACGAQPGGSGGSVSMGGQSGGGNCIGTGGQGARYNAAAGGDGTYGGGGGGSGAGGSGYAGGNGATGIVIVEWAL